MIDTKLQELLDKIKGASKDHLSLVKRKLKSGVWYYVVDYSVKPNKWYALGTKDNDEAERTFRMITSKVHYSNSELGRHIQIDIMKLDREVRERTWSDAFNAAIDQGQGKSTINTHTSSWNHAIVGGLKDELIVKTTRAMILDCYRSANSTTQKVIRMSYNYAQDEGWLLDSNLVPRNDWRKYKKRTGGHTAAIKEEDHFKIIDAMEHDLSNWNPATYRNGRDEASKARWGMARRSKDELLEIKLWLEILWELGASNGDAAKLNTSSINWDTGHVIFKRQKWVGVKGGVGEREREPIKFPMTQKLKQILRPLYNAAMKRDGDADYLLPLIADKPSSNRKRVWDQYRIKSGVSDMQKCYDGVARKITIHSYRYRMAEYLAELGYTERESQKLLGHQSVMVHRSYAKHADMAIPAPDEMAIRSGHDKDIDMKKAV